MSISIEKIKAPELIRSLNGPNGLTRWVICFIDDVTATQFKDRVIGKPNIHKDPFGNPTIDQTGHIVTVQFHVYVEPDGMVIDGGMQSCLSEFCFEKRWVEQFTEMDALNGFKTTCKMEFNHDDN